MTKAQIKPAYFSAPPRPVTEAWRLKRLRELGVLNGERDPELDAIVAEAARLFDAPIALVTLVDEYRQHFKARVGLDVEGTSRAVSFCGHAIMGREPLIVPDSAADPRFAGNPLVTGDPHIAFYMGVPLITSDRQAIGTLCVIDHGPRDGASKAEIAGAKALAARVVARIEDIQPSA